MNLHECVIELTELQIEQFARNSNRGELVKVLSGISKSCSGLAVGEEPMQLQFIYINGETKLTGYIVELKYKQEGFYTLIAEFCHEISLEFERENPISLYNKYLDFLRTHLEGLHFFTIPIDHIERLKRKYEGHDIEFISNPFQPMVIIPFLNPKEFYFAVFGIKEDIQIVDDKNHIYLMLDCRNGLFKIGRSKNPIKREKTLQSEVPETTLIALWEGDPQIEKGLHEKYKSKNIRGEWFRLSHKDILELKQSLI